MNAIIHANEKDNVVTCVRHLKKGEQVSIEGKTYTVNEDIPVFHKMAIADVEQYQTVFKYGEIIGVAHEDIKIGDHIHVHNIESTRGRGDKQ